MMVVAASTAPNLKTTPSLRSQSNPRRPPLLVSERDNNVSAVNPPPNHRRPKSREVSSRYLSTSSSSSTSGSSSSTLSNSSHLSSSRRFASPIPVRMTAPATPAANASAIKRAMSMERRRPATPAPTTTAAAKMLVSSARRLSVSFQGDSFGVAKTNNRAKTAPSPSPNLRKGTPERRKTTSTTTPAVATSPTPKNGEIARPVAHQPWPGRSRPVPASLSRSLDLGCDGKKLINGSTKVIRALRGSLIGDAKSNRTSSDDKQLRRSMSRAETVKWVRDAHDANCVNSSDLGPGSLICDTESVSSECNSGSQDSNTSIAGSKVAGGRAQSIVVPARVWPDANSRLKRVSEPGSPVVRRNSLKGPAPPKLVVPKKLVNDTPGTSPRGTVNNRGLSSPLRGSMRPASPSMLRMSVASERSSSPFRGNASPSRARNASPSRVSNATLIAPSVLCFGADVRRGKVMDNRLGDAHLLRLLHNRHLQWRFVNARTEASLSIQKTKAERSVYNAWRTTSDLRGVVSHKRKELQWLKQKLKLVSILKGQMQYLEEWPLMDSGHCSSLSGAAESLKASIIRLPLVGGARADIQGMRDAICSAADVMQAMASSICSLLEKVGEVDSLMAEVANITLKEHSLLSECKEILSTLAAMQVKDCSVRAHLLQLKSAPSSLTVGT